MDKEPNSSDMVVMLFEELEGPVDKPADTLPKGPIGAFDVLCSLTTAVMPATEDDGLIGSPKIGIKLGV